MFWNDPQFKEKYYNFLYKKFSFKNDLKLIDLDFQKPWWQLYTAQKFTLMRFLFTSFFLNGYKTLFPILLGLSINARRFDLLFAVIGGMAFMRIYNFFEQKQFIILDHTINLNYRYFTQLFFQTVDPVHHSTRSSGQIISKLNRGEQGLDKFLGTLRDELLPFLIRLVVTSITFLQFNIRLGFIAMGVIVFMLAFDLVTRSFQTSVVNPHKIKVSDKAKSVEIESLAQVSHIRSTFATSEQTKKLKNSIFEELNVWSIIWRANNVILLLGSLISIFGLFLIAYSVMILIGNSELSLAVGLSIIVTFYSVNEQSYAIGKRVQELVSSAQDIDDTFKFISSFGKQTYPVLEGEGVINNE